MATQPHPTPPQPTPPPPPKPDDDEPEAGKTIADMTEKERVEFDAERRKKLYGMDEHGIATRDAQWDPNPGELKTVQREQLERSAELEKEGLDKWQAAHSTKPADEKPKAVPGVSPTSKDDKGKG